jgi:DNA replication initiation complex subunit (GINS family)
MGEQDIVITYETIFEVLKQEKERLELQKLDEGFYQRVVDYLKGKRQLAKGTLMSIEEAKKNEKQIENIKRMLKELYDRREKKLVGLAVDKCKTGMDIDKSKMQKEEQDLFDSLVCLISKFRIGIIENILQENMPVIGEEKKAVCGSEENPLENNNDKTKNNTMLIRFISAVPKFLDEDLIEYGPFEEEDVARLPTAIAKVIISKGRAEEMVEE